MKLLQTDRPKEILKKSAFWAFMLLFMAGIGLFAAQKYDSLWDKYMIAPRGATKRTALDFYKTNSTVDANASEIIPVLIGATRLGVPAGYIDTLGSWDKESQYYYGYLGLRFDMRDFHPHATKELRDVTFQITVWADEDKFSTSRKGDGFNRDKHIDRYGLEGWVSKEDSQYTEIFRSDLSNGGRFSAQCMPPEPRNQNFNLLCRSSYREGGVYWTYQFSRSKLSQWREIHSGVNAALKSFYVDGPR